MVDQIGQNFANALSQQTQKQSGSDQGTSNFEEVLKGTLEDTNQAKLESRDMADGLAAGEHRKIHETMIAAQEADLSFRLVTQVRNKVVDAYREIFRMPV
ncbi:flagellar hook-basal body complex protein FliE [Thiohalorhabdus methylotrophus]|uniref:Flagellar hook-basal body complex protein FliE n=1 Tax=Thiohalorhabdus methylotrophus TaxID=3242694 RepID=A0ABV4TY84_9GAMM